jgi:hypothetical protein
MATANTDKFRWARRVPRNQVRRLYERDGQGIRDDELLNEVGYGFYARCCDMFQIQQARNGVVTCRGCGVKIVRRRHAMAGNAHKDEVLSCPKCGWEVTWGEYYRSFTGSRMVTGSATDVFRNFVDRWPQVRTAAAKMELIDELIHEFHVNQRIEGRPVGENVIGGTRKQVIALIEALAYGDASLADRENHRAWRARLNDPIRQFRQSHSWAKTRAMAKALGVPAPARTENQRTVVAEILRRTAENGG